MVLLAGRSYVESLFGKMIPERGMACAGNDEMGNLVSNLNVRDDSLPIVARIMKLTPRQMQDDGMLT